MKLPSERKKKKNIKRENIYAIESIRFKKKNYAFHF